MENDADDLILTEPEYPFQKHLGFRMLGWRDGWAKFELPLGEHLLNRHGIPHGGVYASLLDTVMGYSGSYSGDPDRRRNALTLSMTTNFLSRPQDTKIIAEGRRTAEGRSTFFAEGRITNPSGGLVATATGVFRFRADGPLT